MTLFTLNKQLRLALFLLTVFVIVGGLSSASACLRSEQGFQYKKNRVNICHIDGSSIQKSLDCCQSEICHRSAPLKHDLGLPEYLTQQTSQHPFVHDPRSQAPPLRKTAAFQPSAVSGETISRNPPRVHLPRQAIENLRTVVLLH